MRTPFICDDCRTLHPAEGLNHFELFELAPAYDLDVADLRSRYLRLSRSAHPDQHADERDVGIALRLSALLNEAHRVLSDPVLRAEYLLELHGGPSAADDKNVPPEVLATTLELREEIAEAKADDDSAPLDACRTRATELRSAAMDEIASLARGLPGDDSTRSALRATLNAMRYYDKLLAEI